MKRFKKILLMLCILYPLIILIEENATYKINKKYYPWMTQEVQQHIKYCTDYWSSIYQVDDKLIYALIRDESAKACGNNFKKMEKVVSKAGAIGIMQLMPVHAKNPKNPKEFYDWKENIKKGTWYFARSMRKSKGNIKTACRYYNAGLNSKEENYKNWKYVNNIHTNYKEYKYAIYTSEKLYAMR